MDTIVIVGQQDEKLDQLFGKLGYGTLRPSATAPLAEIIHSNVVDIVVLDGRQQPGCDELCTFLRNQEPTRLVPIVVLSDVFDDIAKIEAACFDKMEILHAPISMGTLASRVATSLRLRKFAGADESRASLAEINTLLRDLNSRFKKDLDDARAIQQSLLPEKLPGSELFEIAASYQPLEEVGGDWYFCEAQPDGAILFGVADVTGHGLSAAFIGSMAKLALVASGKGRPDEILAGMNRLMAPQIPSGRFVTMCCARFDPATGELLFARAGHPPGVLVRRTVGEPALLKGTGFALGFFEDSEYELVRDTLEPGDVFVLYTDGLSEAQNRSIETYGIDRLAKAVAKTRADAKTTTILEGLLDDFDAFRQDRTVKDDVTVIALRCLKRP